MAIPFDATSGSQGTGDLSWTHTPVGTPKGVLVLITQATEADGVTAVTYGGVSMTEVALSPLLGQSYTIFGYFLGSSIPTGAQTVAVTTSGTLARRGRAFTVTADAATTEVEDTSTLSNASLDDPNVDLTTGVGVETFIAAYLVSGRDTGTGVSPGADYTQVDEDDEGTEITNVVRRTTNGAGGTVNVNWGTGAADTALILAVAIKESAVGGVTLTGGGAAATAGTGNLLLSAALAGKGANSSAGTGQLLLSARLAGAGANASAGSAALTVTTAGAVTGRQIYSVGTALRARHKHGVRIPAMNND